MEGEVGEGGREREREGERGRVIVSIVQCDSTAFNSENGSVMITDVIIITHKHSITQYF